MRTATEKITFALPKNLRADLKTGGSVLAHGRRREPGAAHTC